MLSAIRRDITAVKERDPAARTTAEVILCYPGLHAVWGHRITHWLWHRNAKLPARFLAEMIRKLDRRRDPSRRGARLAGCSSTTPPAW